MNEETRKQFLEKLQKQKVINEKLNNQVIEFKHTNSLIKMETDIIGDRLNILNDSIKSLGNFKEQEGKTALYPGIETPDSTSRYTYKVLLIDKSKEISNLRSSIDQLKYNNSTLLDERDNCRKDLKTLNKVKTKIIDDKDRNLATLKRKNNDLIKDLKDTKDDRLSCKDELSNLQKAYK